MLMPAAPKVVRRRRWSDSDILIDPPERFHTYGPRRPRFQPPLDMRLLPGRAVIEDSLRRARPGAPAAAGEDPAPPSLPIAASVAPAAPPAVRARSQSPAAPASSAKRIASRRPSGAAAPLSASLAARVASEGGRPVSAGDTAMLRPAGKSSALTSPPRQRRRRDYDSLVRWRRERRPHAARQLVGPLTGHLRRRASMIVVAQRAQLPMNKIATGALIDQYMPDMMNDRGTARRKMTDAEARRLRPADYEQFYSKRRVLERESIRFHPDVLAVSRRMWTAYTNCLGRLMTKAGHGLLFRHVLRVLPAITGHALEEDNLRADDKDALVKNLEDDWSRDSGGNPFMDFAHFALAFFELADFHCPVIDPVAYSRLLARLTNVLTRPTPRGDSWILNFRFDHIEPYRDATTLRSFETRRLAAQVAIVMPEAGRFPPIDSIRPRALLRARLRSVEAPSAAASRPTTAPLPPPTAIPSSVLPPRPIRVAIIMQRRTFQRSLRPPTSPVDFEFDYLSRSGLRQLVHAAHEGQALEEVTLPRTLRSTLFAAVPPTSDTDSVVAPPPPDLRSTARPPKVVLVRPSTAAPRPAAASTIVEHVRMQARAEARNVPADTPSYRPLGGLSHLFPAVYRPSRRVVTSK